jgi:hypothetical protein
MIGTQKISPCSCGFSWKSKIWQQAVEKCPSVALRCTPRQSAYACVCLIPRLLRALHLDIFEQPVQNRVFQQVLMTILNDSISDLSPNFAFPGETT